MAIINGSAKVLDNQDMSTSWTSPAISLKRIFDFSITCNVVAGGAPTGTLSLEQSNSSDESHLGLDSSSWVTVPDSSQAIVDGGLITWNVSHAGWRWARVRWVSTSGTGTADVLLSVKGV